MDTLTALTTRVSSPRLQEPGPNDEQIDMLLRAAILRTMACYAPGALLCCRAANVNGWAISWWRTC
jgi:hypothetical protein